MTNAKDRQRKDRRRGRGSGKGGRPPKEGPRFPGGKLKPPAQAQAAKPNARVIEERRRLLGDNVDLTKATNPMDFALAKGWISAANHRTGAALAGLYASSGIGGSTTGTAKLGETDTSIGFEATNWAEMPDAQVEALWDRVFNKASPDEESESARALVRWRAANAAMTPGQRNEVFLVCIMQSWPQWIVHRVNEALRAEDQDSETVRRVDGRAWERKRDLLLAGLTVAAKALKPQGDKGSTAAIESAKAPKRAKVADTTIYVDQDGKQLLEVVRLKSTPKRGH